MPNEIPDNESDDNISEEKTSLDQLSHEDLQEKLLEAEQKSQQYWDRIIRMQAENENFSRRSERDISNAHKYALEKFVNELVPIVDSLELCITTEANEKNSSLTDGVNLTLKMFYAALEKFGVKQIHPINEHFDPEFQQAISVQLDSSVEPGTVLSVLQKGYTLNNRLIRPALVVVSKVSEE